MSRNPIPPRVPPKGAIPAKPPAPRAVPLPRPIAAPALPVVADPSPTETSSVPPQPIGAKSEVVARAASYYRTTRYIMALLLLGMGGWFGYDGFKGWPAENVTIVDLNRQLDAAKLIHDSETADKINLNPVTHKALHSDTDLLIQKALAFALPLGSLLMLCWALYNSRGEYRLTGTTLSVPGHRAVQFADIAALDKQLWDRKGIAYVTYKGTSGSGRVRLDDFIYEREPTDEIYERIAAYLAGERAEVSPEEVT